MRITVKCNHTHPAVLCSVSACLSILLTVFAENKHFHKFLCLEHAKGMIVIMIKVVLLDDEETIIEGLKILIDWSSLGFNIVGCGYDGDEGYELTCKLKPDILITDIKMPGISGLELIDKVKAVVPNIKIIILSGYDQFDYAKTALEKGVLGYLLKPVKRTELIEKLINIRKIIDNEAIELQKQKNLENKLNYLYSLAKYKYINDILSGNIQIESFNNLDLSLLGIEKTSDNFCIIVFELDYSTCSCSKEYLFDYIDSYVKSKSLGILVEHSHNKLVLWNFLFDKNSDIDYTIWEIKSILSKFHIVQASIGVSSISDRIDTLPRLFNEANLILDETFKYGKGITLYYERIVLTDKNHINIIQFKNQIFSSLDSLDKDKTADVVNKIFEFMLNNSQYTSDDIYVECINIFVYLKDMAIDYSVKDFTLFNYNYFNIIYLKQNYSTCHSLKKFLLRVTNELIDIILKTPKNSVYILVDQIKKYMKNNYASVTRESAAEHFHITPAYLSKIFKQVTKTSFIDFLTQIKMEEAKKLLLSSPIQVQELSEKLGYSKSQYFSSVFENYSGFTPVKFRKKYMKG